ncbi:MAG TPA: BamA/TamA family outer membrane protein [Burkholderiaceae bacterium]|nr:BamA/TamA family outer membrane protein [Burkholderiaceae bacterium]
MTLRGGLRAALVAVAALALGGCAHLPFGLGEKAPEAAPAPGAAASGPATDATPRAEYRLEVEAPEPLRQLLLDYLDLARFQNAPSAERITAPELERLLRAAPAQARGLLETEGHFNAEVSAERAGEQAGLPVLRVRVAPGPRATVGAVSIEATGALHDAAQAGDAAARAELEALRAQWPLRPGDAFRQSAWSGAKNTTLARLRADGYAAAAWSSTNARVDAPGNRVEIAVVLDSGPLYRLGAVRIDGLQRYDDASVRRLATFASGDPYSEKRLLDYQERLQKTGLFESATVEIDADPATAAATPVRVHVKEQTLQQATFGVGYSANTGPRLSVEHTQRRLFGQALIAKNKVVLGPDNQRWDGELSTYPKDDQSRYLVSGSASKLLVDDQQVLGWNARVGRARDTGRIERLEFAEVTHARLDSDALSSQADAVSGNAQWVFRNVDNVLLPTRGRTTSAQLGLGVARGNRSVKGEALEQARGPFARLYARLTWYEPIGSTWFGNARLEAGQVLTHSAVGIPDTLLFRAGGEDSVRGYGYRTLGPSIAGVTVGGRTLLTGSVELARPIVAKYPDIWGAVFVDAGNAADRWADLKPAVGYGVGARWRSPVGPLRVDLAYGQQVHQVRVHFSIGVAF